MIIDNTARLALYVQSELGKGHSKTAEGILRYTPERVVAVIDSTQSGKSIESAVGIKHPAPIVDSVQNALAYNPNMLVLGTAWTGGKMPTVWRQDIIFALKSGLDIVNGLHDFLSDDKEIVNIAYENQKTLFDVRRPPPNLPVGTAKALKVKAKVVLTVGTSSSIGKMTTSLELMAAARRAGVSAEFIATGQTGIMIAGSGICIDRVIGDFMAGAVEKMVLEADRGNEFIFVEGQGSLAHPGFSGVTLALMHGACPKAFVLCQKVVQKTLPDCDLPTPGLTSMIEATETLSKYVTPAKVLAIALNTSGLNEQEALDAITKAEKETKLPCADPVRFGTDKLFNALR